MGTLDTIAGLASLGMQVASLKKLGDLQQQGVSSAELLAFQNQIKNEIFKINNAAKSVLEYEEENRKIVTGALKLLEAILQRSGLSPDIFMELSDKEYFVATTRLIKSNASRLYNNLSPSEQSEIDQMVSKAQYISEYEYYLGNMELVENYRKALPLTKSSQGCSGAISAPVGWIAIGLAGCVVLFGATAQDAFGAALIIALLVGGMGFFAVRQGQKYRDSVDLVNRVRQEVDLEWYGQLEKQFAALGAVEVGVLKEEAETISQNFFGDENIFAAL